jgi:hypothetical protein
MTFEIRRFVLALIRSFPASRHAALVKRQAFFAMGNPRMQVAPPLVWENASQNLNKESQIMVSAMRGQGDLSCTERKTL